jgi:KEOPS complex subunit Pcc1
VHESRLEFDYQDAARARVVERSVRREVGDIDGDWSTATVERDGATLTVRVEATDLVGLRAGLNTWQGLVGVAEATAAAAGR